MTFDLDFLHVYTSWPLLTGTESQGLESKVVIRQDQRSWSTSVLPRLRAEMVKSQITLEQNITALAEILGLLMR